MTWITDALARIRKMRVKGRVEMNVKMVWESLKSRREKNWEVAGKPAASKSNLRREEIVRRTGEEERVSDWERRVAAETGKTRRAAVVAREW